MGRKIVFLESYLFAAGATRVCIVGMGGVDTLAQMVGGMGVVRVWIVQ